MSITIDIRSEINRIRLESIGPSNSRTAASSVSYKPRFQSPDVINHEHEVIKNTFCHIQFYIFILVTTIFLTAVLLFFYSVSPSRRFSKYTILSLVTSALQWPFSAVRNFSRLRGRVRSMVMSIFIFVDDIRPLTSNAFSRLIGGDRYLVWYFHIHKAIDQIYRFCRYIFITPVSWFFHIDESIISSRRFWLYIFGLMFMTVLIHKQTVGGYEQTYPFCTPCEIDFDGGIKVVKTKTIIEQLTECDRLTLTRTIIHTSAAPITPSGSVSNGEYLNVPLTSSTLKVSKSSYMFRGSSNSSHDTTTVSAITSPVQSWSSSGMNTTHHLPKGIKMLCYCFHCKQFHRCI